MQVKFTVVLTAADYVGSGETLTMSRHVDNEDKQSIYNFCKSEALVSDEEVDTILWEDIKASVSNSGYFIDSQGFVCHQ